MRAIYYVLIVIGALFLYECGGGPSEAAPQAQAVSVPVLSITRGNATTFQEYPVTVEGRVNVEIRPQVDGYLQKVFVDEGALVKKGQPLFKIEDHRYRELVNNALGTL